MLLSIDTRGHTERVKVHVTHLEASTPGKKTNFPFEFNNHFRFVGKPGRTLVQLVPNIDSTLSSGIEPNLFHISAKEAFNDQTSEKTSSVS